LLPAEEELPLSSSSTSGVPTQEHGNESKAQEAEAKLKIQEETRSGRFQLAFSPIFVYENNKNPYQATTGP